MLVYRRNVVEYGCCSRVLEPWYTSILSLHYLPFASSIFSHHFASTVFQSLTRQPIPHPPTSTMTPQNLPQSGYRFRIQFSRPSRIPSRRRRQTASSENPELPAHAAEIHSQRISIRESGSVECPSSLPHIRHPGRSLPATMSD